MNDAEYCGQEENEGPEQPLVNASDATVSPNEGSTPRVRAFLSNGRFL